MVGVQCDEHRISPWIGGIIPNYSPFKVVIYCGLNQLLWCLLWQHNQNTFLVLSRAGRLVRPLPTEVCCYWITCTWICRFFLLLVKKIACLKQDRYLPRNACLLWVRYSYSTACPFIWIEGISRSGGTIFFTFLPGSGNLAQFEVCV